MEVVRVSLNSSEGELNERGRIEKVFSLDGGEPFGYLVVWEKKPQQGQYVAPQRIQTVVEWTRAEQQRPRQTA